MRPIRTTIVIVVYRILHHGHNNVSKAPKRSEGVAHRLSAIHSSTYSHHFPLFYLSLLTCGLTFYGHTSSRPLEEPAALGHRLFAPDASAAWETNRFTWIPCS
ncbi:hypothetical protein Q1695_007504 [Nippostrongylus brasiliensis]|nr:hypothetical protein Q1695_007504 [Nippostrongylus brasiliensis]